MNREAALKIAVGDMIQPDPLWNQTDRRKLASPTRVLKIKHARSQTGVLFLVAFMGERGGAFWLDAGWFR